MEPAHQSTSGPPPILASLANRPSEKAKGGRAGLRPGRKFIWGAIAVLLAVTGVYALPSEISRWYLAAALEAQRQGDVQRAADHFTTAIQWDPDQTELYLSRSFLLLRLGQFDQAVEDSHVLVEDSRQRFREQKNEATRLAYAESLNHRAYARALANREIDQGLEDIRKAFELIGNEEKYHMLDTRGYLRFLAGDLDGARQDLERAIELGTARSTRLSRAQQQPSLSLDQRDIQNHRESMAVLYHHRGQIYQALGRDEEASADLKLAEELGYDPKKGVL